MDIYQTGFLEFSAVISIVILLMSLLYLVTLTLIFHTPYFVILTLTSYYSCCGYSIASLSSSIWHLNSFRISIHSTLHFYWLSQHWYVVSDIRFKLSSNLLIACLIWWFNIGSFVLQYITIYRTLWTGALYCTTWGTLLWYVLQYRAAMGWTPAKARFRRSAWPGER